MGSDMIRSTQLHSDAKREIADPTDPSVLARSDISKPS
jgi:hypothetical protein